MRTICVLIAAFLSAPAALAQTDPGPRSAPAAAGGPLTGLGPNELAYFKASQATFREVDTFQNGLGPRMNLNSCAGCHAQPAVGGSSPAINPQVAFANLLGSPNTLPSFISADGPVREARFVKNPDGTHDGGVHALFVITPKVGAPAACSLAQPNFAQALAQRNVIFRIPTPTFGLGLVENLNDAQLALSFNANAAAKARLGISGHFNTNGNDGTIAKFGWKAQNKSGLIFSGEAYNVEMGITNEAFTDERDEAGESLGNCIFAKAFNSSVETDATSPAESQSDTERFAFFMRFLAAPTPSTTTPGGSASISRGATQFSNVGCALCHTPQLATHTTADTELSKKPVNLFSDLALHHMGSGLNDGISQGLAGPDEFRTAPLWGLGQRLFFMHDGRTTNLLQAIAAHAGGTDCFTNQDFDQFSVNGHFFQPFEQSNVCASEATTAVNNFNALTAAQKQDVLNFLRSL